jgi:DUSAM domain-containing protein
MHSDAQKEKDDWEQLRELEASIVGDEIPDIEKWRPFLVRVCPTLGISISDCETGVETQQGMVNLIREARKRIDDGNARFATLLTRLVHVIDESRREDAQDTLAQFIASEPVVFFREMAQHELDKLAAPRIIAERIYEFTAATIAEPEMVTVRVGAPERSRTTKWMVMVEIVGPNEHRSMHSVAAPDAVTALEHALCIVTPTIDALAAMLRGNIVARRG